MAQQTPVPGAQSAPPPGSDNASPRAGDRIIRIGGILAAVGAVAALIGLLPLLVPAVPSQPAIWFVAIGGVGVGVALSLYGMVRAARARSRALRPD
ncbi:MAG: hypothetical protein E6Q90_03435 [Actinobacteria bacterium]|nr:MAG: hypothetical protein E6Q90_03435 [Actinomycetota bacterium]